MKRSLRRRTRRKLRLAVALLFLPAAVAGFRVFYVTRAEYGLPHIARFESDARDGWIAYGGTWEVADGAMRNDSNDRGAKLISGSPHWRDYVVEGDVALLGHGSAGLLGRVSEAEVGENSYKGYLAAVRTGDNSFIIGSFDFAYHEAARVPIPGGVRLFNWYHVRLRLQGCQITASVSDASMREIATEPVNDPDCFRCGSIGLRSNGTGGIWRNIQTLPLNVAPSQGSQGLPSLRRVAAAYALLGKPDVRDGRSQDSTASAQPIASLLNLSPVIEPTATIRGTIVLTRPALMVQDSSGGVEIDANVSTPLKVGDEVEATGKVDLTGFSAFIREPRIRLLSESVPVSPLPVTASQAAAGQYDDRFVQVEGTLRSVSTGSDGSLVMRVDSGAQSFRALLPRGRSYSHWRDLAPESGIRLKGISTVNRRFNRAADPFVILVRSAEDLEIVSGPPWWRPSTLILAGLVALCLAFTVNHFYLRVKHWRLCAIADERERLANEIHDTLAQSFAGIGFQLQAMRNSMPQDGSTLERQLELAITMTRTSHEEARRSIATLHPQSPGPAGLLSALRECAEKMVLNGGVTVQASGDPNLSGVPASVRDTLYHIGQEAIANAVRHADPRTIHIRIENGVSAVSLCVEDDGKGFSGDCDYAGFGLSAMRKKAESISGALAIRSRPGSGTRVEVRAPAGRSFISFIQRPHLKFF